MNTCEAKWHIAFFSHIHPVEDQQLQPPYPQDFLLEGGAWNNLVPRLLSTLPVPSRCERTLVLSGHVISQILGYRVICH